MTALAHRAEVCAWRWPAALCCNDISLSLSSGHLVALVGPNGAGKTTLLRALGRTDPVRRRHPGRRRRAVVAVVARTRASASAICRRGTSCTGRCRRRDIVALGRYPHGATDPARLSPARRRGGAAGDAGDRCHGVLASAASPNCPAASAAASRWPACSRWRRRSSWPDEPTASLDPRHQIDVMKCLRAGRRHRRAGDRGDA